MRASAMSPIIWAPILRTSFDRTTRGRPPGYSNPIASRCSGRKSVRWATIAGPDPPGARRRRQQLHATRLPARPLERAPRRRLAELKRATPEPVLQFVHALVRPEGGGVDIEVTPLDLAPAEKAAAPSVAIARERQELGLRKAIRRRRGRDGGDARGRHSPLPSPRLRVRWEQSEHTARVQTMPLFS